MMVHIYNPNIKQEEQLRIWAKPWSNIEFKDSLGYSVISYLKKKKKKKAQQGGRGLLSLVAQAFLILALRKQRQGDFWV